MVYVTFYDSFYDTFHEIFMPMIFSFQNKEEVSVAKDYLGWRRNCLLFQREVTTSAQRMLQTKQVRL